MRDAIAIVDCGGANIASLLFALQRLGATASLSADPAVIEAAGHVILPGVGAAADAMARLRARGLHELMPQLQQPVLGICLGMQLLARHSEEDDAGCLDVFPVAAAHLPVSDEAPVPNMGWCRVYRQREHALLDGIDDGAWFYFVHSYALPDNPDSLASARHADDFCAVIGRGNFLATQFHPERSAAAGARVLENFLRL